MKIESPCCYFSNTSTYEIHVLLSDCPIKRELGKRIIKDRKTKSDREEVTCIYVSGFDGEVIPACKYYNGIKEDKKIGKYIVDCSYYKW